MAKGAAPSRELVRTGIENMLKEVLGAMSDEKVELKQMGKSYDFEDSPFTLFDGF